MAEYICRELLKRAVHASDLENREKMALLTCISSIPSAEVAPVRHGKWILEDACGQYWRTCSECSELQMGQTPTFTYCPHCGAKMDVEETEK